MAPSGYAVFLKRPGDLSMALAINAAAYRTLKIEDTMVVESPLTDIEFWLVSATTRKIGALMKIPNVSESSVGTTKLEQHVVRLSW